MPWPNVFDWDHCSISAPKPDFRFISDCTILPAPPPIFDCPDLILPFDVPPPIIPIPEICIPCPTLGGSATARWGSDSSCGKGDPQVNLSIRQVNSDDSCGQSCEYEFIFDFVIPKPIIPCPEITGQAGTSNNSDIMQDTSDCKEGSATFNVDLTVTQNEQGMDECSIPSKCEYNFDFDFELKIPRPVIPCPELTTGSEGSNANATVEMVPVKDCSEGSADFKATVAITPGENECANEDSCTYDFDFDFELKIPQPVIPCPELTTGSGSNATADGNVEMVPVKDCSEGEAAFSVTADVNITPGDNECANEDSCTYNFDFDFQFDLKIPTPVIPCPTLGTGSDGSNANGTVEMVPVKDCSQGSADFKANVTITPGDNECANEDSCTYDFDFDFELKIPEPVIPCPTLGTGSDGSNATATVEMVPVQDCSQGSPDFKAAVTITPGENECANEGSCTYDFDFDFDLKIPEPVIPCPVITGGSGSNANASGTVEMVPVQDCSQGSPAFDVTADVTITPGDNECANEDSCTYNFDFDFNFDLKIPEPVIPCPTIGTGSGGSNATADGTLEMVPVVDCSQGQPEFSVTADVTITPGANECANEDSCTYDLDFDFHFDLKIPEPVIPCPTITAGGSEGGGNASANVEMVPVVDCSQGQPDLDVTVTLTPGDNECANEEECTYDFDFDFDLKIPEPVIPCPTITAGGSDGGDASANVEMVPVVDCSQGAPELTVGVTLTPGDNECANDEPCEYNFDFDFDLKIPEPVIPCPTITVQGGSDGGEATATVEMLEPVGCSEGDPELTVNVTLTPGDNECANDEPCEYNFDFDFDLKIPKPAVPCPEIEATATMTIVDTEDEAGVDVQVTPGTNEDCPSVCEYLFDFEFRIPRTVMSGSQQQESEQSYQCPKITATATGNGDCTATVDVSKIEGEECGYHFDFTIDCNCGSASCTCEPGECDCQCSCGDGGGGCSCGAPQECEGWTWCEPGGWQLTWGAGTLGPPPVPGRFEMETVVMCPCPEPPSSESMPSSFSSKSSISSVSGSFPSEPPSMPSGSQPSLSLPSFSSVSVDQYMQLERLLGMPIPRPAPPAIVGQPAAFTVQGKTWGTLDFDDNTNPITAWTPAGPQNSQVIFAVHGNGAVSALNHQGQMIREFSVDYGEGCDGWAAIHAYDGKLITLAIDDRSKGAPDVLVGICREPEVPEEYSTPLTLEPATLRACYPSGPYIPAGDDGLPPSDPQASSVRSATASWLDKDTGDIYIVTKATSPAQIFRLPYRCLTEPGPVTLEYVGLLTLSGIASVAVSEEAKEVVATTYDGELWRWSWSEVQPMLQSIREAPHERVDVYNPFAGPLVLWAGEAGLYVTTGRNLDEVMYYRRSAE